MTDQHAFAAQHYGPRAQAYVASAVHAAGADLDQIEAEMRARLPARVLDLGCGGGHVSYRAAPFAGQVTACDVTPAMLDAVAATAAERGIANIGTCQAPAERLPFADGTFDAVLCRFSAHHWQDLDAGLREGRRVLAPRGHAIFIDTVAPANPLADTHLQAIELLRDVSHVRNYSVAQWAAALGRAGFAIESLTIRRLRMDFPVWIGRTAPPASHVAAIRSLQEGAPPAVRAHLAIDADASFDLESATFVLQPA